MGVCIPVSIVNGDEPAAATRDERHGVSIRHGMGTVGKPTEDNVAQFLHRTLPEGRLHAALQKSWTWLDVNIFDLGRQMRVSYLPH